MASKINGKATIDQAELALYNGCEQPMAYGGLGPLVPLFDELRHRYLDARATVGTMPPWPLPPDCYWLGVVDLSAAPRKVDNDRLKLLSDFFVDISMLLMPRFLLLTQPLMRDRYSPLELTQAAGTLLGGSWRKEQRPMLLLLPRWDDCPDPVEAFTELRKSYPLIGRLQSSTPSLLWARSFNAQHAERLAQMSLQQRQAAAPNKRASDSERLLRLAVAHFVDDLVGRRDELPLDMRYVMDSSLEQADPLSMAAAYLQALSQRTELDPECRSLVEHCPACWRGGNALPGPAPENAPPMPCEFDAELDQLAPQMPSALREQVWRMRWSALNQED